MCSISHRSPFLLAFAVAVAMACSGGTPAMAACSPGAADKPDLAFKDSNCDGIDGDKASALFVAPGGSDAADGSFGHPKATIAAAVTAGLAAHRDVYVAAGTYDGKVSFLGSTGDIGVYGGYDPQTWARSEASVATVRAPGQVVGVAVPGIVLQLLKIQGLAPGTTTSYGVRAFYSGSVALSRTIVEPSAGGDGASGADAPQSQPAAAPDGHQGVGNPNCDPNALKGTFNHGGLGGSDVGLLSGGQGGWWRFPPGWPFAGDPGQGDPGVGPGLGGDEGWPGGPGSPGKQGTGGMPGYADLNAGATIYVPQNGGPGAAGTRGAGGGGGGMGINTCVPGSGGGAGGRPGAGGEGGHGGGGSIGVFAGAGARVLVIDGSAIHTANGGKGGNGGLGQPGGEGGNGGPPGVDIYEGMYPGTSGGHGGKGGPGGRGGGAAGGASIGVLTINARAVVAADTAITLGQGGQFGIGGHNGWQGVAQKTAQVTTAGGTQPGIGDFDGDGIADDTDACPIAAGTGTGCPADAPADSGGGPSGGGGSTGSTGPSTGPVTVSVLPASSCVSKRVFRLRINPRRAHLKSARLTLDGHRIRLVKGKRRWTARIDLRRSKRTRHTLTIRGRLRDGRAYRQVRHYRTCRV